MNEAIPIDRCVPFRPRAAFEQSTMSSGAQRLELPSISRTTITRHLRDQVSNTHIGGFFINNNVAVSRMEGVAGTGMGPTATGPDVMPVSDGSSLLTTTAAGTGSRFFHTTVATGSGPRTAGGGGGLLSAAGGGAAPHSGGGMTSGAEMLTGQHLTVFGQAAGGPGHHGTHRGGGGGGAAGGPAGLLPAGTLMMDAEGGLYTYTMDG
ncbi:hypothetical protein Vretimale_11708 [Volvox reticuliferus]|uniref:Uncharacterized protein n=1 Tax=Volvox reticuliferus TaxID=1737510 RepID=A0A8J4GH39_9CHLO|nr:hypothetical protein Vretimale_11708 [Volvox reticuliferus]